jgi:hypothetical protein
MLVELISVIRPLPISQDTVKRYNFLYRENRPKSTRLKGSNSMVSVYQGHRCRNRARLRYCCWHPGGDTDAPSVSASDPSDPLIQGLRGQVAGQGQRATHHCRAAKRGMSIALNAKTIPQGVNKRLASSVYYRVPAIGLLSKKSSTPV